MARSKRLSLREVRQAMRVVGECRDLGHDAAGWLRHATEGALRLVQGRVIQAGITPPEGFRLLSETALLFNLGWDDTDQERVAQQAMSHEAHLQDPSFQAYLRLEDRNVTLRPVRLVTRPAFEATDTWALRKTVGIDDFLFSQRKGGKSRSTFVLSPQRAFGDPYFTRRETRLLRVYHDELALLLGTVLSDGTDGGIADLSPRLRQTLAALLEGDGEKQAAARLGVSRHTVHEYITALYRRFGVHSRAELLVYCQRRRIGPPPAS